MNKMCQTCRIVKSLGEFGNNLQHADGKQNYCTKCGTEKDKEHYARSSKRRDDIRASNGFARERNMRHILEYLSLHPCVDCGEPDPLVLDFDHLGNKNYDVGSMRYNGLDALKLEMGKCEVRCANCHRRKTAKQFGFMRYNIAGVL